MSHQSLPELLSSVDLFEGVPRACIDDLIEAGSTMHTQPGHVVVAQGSDDAGLHVVVSGDARVEVEGVGKTEDLATGDYFGEISVIDGGGRAATITAGADGLDTFTISPLAFWSIVDCQPAISRSLLRHLSGRIRELDASNRGGLC
jgi:CRP-like cAMP-binding protein